MSVHETIIAFEDANHWQKSIQAFPGGVPRLLLIESCGRALRRCLGNLYVSLEVLSLPVKAAVRLVRVPVGSSELLGRPKRSFYTIL